MKTLLNKLRRPSPGLFLSVLFLTYIAFVCFSCLPDVLYETKRCLYWNTGVNEYITSINKIFDDCLDFEQSQSALVNKGTYINLNGLMAKQMGQTQLNNRVLLKNGLLASVSDSIPEKDDLRYCANNLIQFCKKHQENGGHFLFVMAPSKISKYEDVLPVGYTDTDNEVADELIAQLQEGSVPVLDLRETLREEGIPWNEAFFTTDHHWTPQIGFLAFREIVQTLSENGAAKTPDSFCLQESNYTFHTYENTFLGSAGKRTGIYFAGMDDSIFIAPNYPTDIRLTIPEMGLDLRGPYEQISYHQDSGMDLDHPSPFTDNMYGLYGWGDTAISHWRNEQASAEQRVLLIGDSFANIPFSLMSLCYSSCDEMDMRYYHEDFAEYYREYQPQTIVFLINPNNCVSEFTGADYLTEAN